ncbi:hypothetical protein Q5752_003721 [Cryptotrichosporon argae]
MMRRASSQHEDEDGLVMRDKAEREDARLGSTGREMGVTKPKRRMSNSVVSMPTTPARLLREPYTNTMGDRTPEHTPEKGISNYLPAAKEGAPTLFGIELKWISLLTLALQNAFLTIVMHYSRISVRPDQTYMAAAAVLLNELLKGTVSVAIALRRIDVSMLAQTATTAAPPIFGAEKDDALGGPLARLPTLAPVLSMLQPSRLRSLVRQVLSPDCYKLAVPAILYVVQNNLQYVAASNLDVATFQVTYQMKILTTAFFSVVLLGKRLSRAKWLALLLLAVGVGVVQLQTTSSLSSSSASASSKAHAYLEERVMHPWRGFVAVTLACMTSGLAGVYFELLLKSSSAGAAPPPDLWIRNTQLSLFSLVPAVVPILFTPYDGRPWVTRLVGCFANFNGWAITTVLTQTFGGLVTALVIRYSDNIMKGFATSLSIILSFLASVALFNYPITFTFIVGAATVLFSTYLYNAPNAPILPEQPTRAAVAVTPGSPISSSAPILGQTTERPSRTSSVINLLGLAPGWTGTAGGSGASSRQPSATDLRAASPSLYGGAAVPTGPPPSSRGGSSTNLHAQAQAGAGAALAPAWGSVGGVPVVGPGAGRKPVLSVDTSR